MAVLPERIREYQLTRRDRLVAYYLLGLGALIAFYVVGYMVVMSELEGADRSVFAAFEFVVQTMTTTGYGQDSGQWSHPVTFLFVAFMQISGIGIGFFTLRLIIIPLFSEADVNLDDRLTPKSDHVVICEYTRDSAVLLDELQELGIDYVLVSSDEAEARELSDRGYAAIDGSPEREEDLERAGIDDARTVIADADDANVSTILTVRGVRPDIEVIALTDDSERADVLRNAGANTVLLPRAVLGRQLAQKAVSAFGSQLGDPEQLGSAVEITEVPVPHDSRLVGTRIRNSRIREETGANVIGAWIDGELQLPPDPDAVIGPHTVLLLTGDHDQLEAFTEFTRPPRTFNRYDRIVLAGLGEVGSAARSVIEDAGLEVVTIDTREDEDVDVVGDATTKETLREAGIETAGAIVVGLPSDADGLLTTVVARSLAEDVEVLVRVSETDATRKALRAGADYVLSVPRVSARLVATELRGEDVVAPASQVRVIRVSAAPFAGTSLADSGIYEETGCRVIAVERDGALSTTFDPARPFDGDEKLTVVGSDEAIQQFEKQFDVSPQTAD